MKALLRFFLSCMAWGAFWISIPILGLFIVVEGMSWWHSYNPLAKYGVTYKIDFGEHEEYQWVNFYWDREGKRINGPEIHDDDLSVDFKKVNGDKFPEIVITSDTYKSHHATLKLNFTDKRKPEFELVECQGMQVEYMNAWRDYYQIDSETGAIVTAPAK